MKLSKPNYKDYLKHPLWQRKRLLICDRDNWTCQKCNDSETELQVHHKHYRSGLKPWEYSDSELITLCANCHFEETLPQIFDRYQIGKHIKKLSFSFGNCKGEDSKLELIIELIFRLSTLTGSQVKLFVKMAEAEAAKFE